MFKPLSVFILILFFLGFKSFSQTWEIGLNGGSFGYMGDLNQRNNFQLKDPALGFNVKYNIDGYWSLKLGFLRGKISDDESKSKYVQEQNRNLSFFTPLNELGLMVDFNFFDYGFDAGQVRISPYLSSGVAVIMFNPQTEYANRIYELKYYSTEGQSEYQTTTYSIPVIAGLKYILGKNLSISTEIGFRNTNTDYLDDVSGTYATPSELSASNPQTTALRIALSDRSINKIGTPGTQRGDFRKKDSYVFVGIGLSYTFVSRKCPF